MKLRQCLMSLGSSGPVPFLLTFCTRTKIGAINSFVRYCSVGWSCVCLSSCGFSSIVSHSFSPFLCPNWPCLLKSLSASAAPAASDSVLRSREALSPRTKTHTYTHTVQCWSVSLHGQEGGRLRMTTTARMTAKSMLLSTPSSKGSSHISINRLTHSIFPPPLWVCIAALSQDVSKQVTLVLLQIASDGHYKHTGNLSKMNVALQLNQ